VTSPSPQQLAAIAAAYAILRAPTPQAERAVQSRWALAGRAETIADAPRSANVASRWALAGRRDG
jgi:hypothetical protein